MADQTSRRTCPRCGHLHTGIPVQPTAHGLYYCRACGTYTLIREMGEMGMADRADPDEWGGLGFQ